MGLYGDYANGWAHALIFPFHIALPLNDPGHPGSLEVCLLQAATAAFSFASWYGNSFLASYLVAATMAVDMEVMHAYGWPWGEGKQRE